MVSPQRSVLNNEPAPTNVKLEKKSKAEIHVPMSLDDTEIEKVSLSDYFERSKDLIKPDGGPPRWFSPLEFGSQRENSPLLLFLPGIFGVGLGLILHQQRMGKIFDIWCLHIPVKDRTPFRDLVHLVEKTVKSENSCRPNRPIYLVGESFGACLALAVAALNPNIDLMLILANPATSFSKSQLQPLLPLMGIIPEQLPAGLPYILNLATGDPLRTMISSLEKGSLLQQTVGELSQIFSVLADILPKEAHLWKLQMLRSASSFVNSRIHAVKAPTLILASGRDQLLPSQEEAERLYRVLPTCQIRNFKDCGHLLLMEDEVDLVTVIKGAGFYRRRSHIDYVSDYFPPTPFEFEQSFDSYRWLETFANPVMFSTLENGKIVKGLEGIPNEGPVILVGYHMLLGFELAPMVARILTEKNILVRGIAHPFMFEKALEERLPDTSGFDVFRLMGAVPVSASNFYRLLSSKSHVLLYPGGVREALHRKGEEYKLYWPEQSEFVRMAARFGAKIVPFGVVGEDDICDVVLDYEDLMKIPFFRSYIEELNAFTSKSRLRTDVDGEIAKQDMHFPGVVPKVPGRFYYLFGKPIETEGRRKELRNREEANEVYLHAKSEVERCIAYLKEKREKDPYRNLLPRLIYQTTHGFQSEVPTFEI